MQTASLTPTDQSAPKKARNQLRQSRLLIVTSFQLADKLYKSVLTLDVFEVRSVLQTVYVIEACLNCTP